MDIESALSFLRNHPNMPEDSSREDIDSLDEVRKFLEQHPDPRCIRPLLAVFSDHMGWGIYQLFDDALAKYSIQELAPHLNDALRSELVGTRWWAAHWALAFPAPILTDELLNLIGRVEDLDAHYFAISALAEIYCTTRDLRIRQALDQRKRIETDGEVLELLDECLEELDTADRRN